MPKSQNFNVPFNGKLITAEPSSIGANFQSLKNLRYTDTHLKGVPGMTKAHDAVMNATYLKTRSAFHFSKSQPAESHILSQAWATALTSSKVIQNTAVIPATAAWSATTLWTDTTAASTGRFSDAPDGQMIYCNGVDSCIWGGTETKIGSLISTTVALAAGTDTCTSPKDYTDQMNNTKHDAANIFTCGGSYKTFLIGSTRPASGATFYFDSVNVGANTLVIKESTAGVWTTIAAGGITDGTRNVGDTASFTKDGKISWPTTVASTKPKYLEGYYLYWYQFTISGGTADIYHITLDCPFQPILDMWDGVYREISRFYKYTTSQTDETLKVLADDYEVSTASTYSDVSSLATGTQYLECGFFDKMTGIFWAIPPGYENLHAAAVAAVGTITVTATSVTAETFLIDTQTFTWAAARTVAGTVTVGTDTSSACANIKAAVNLDLSTVVAVHVTASQTVTITAVVLGTAGNSIDFTETCTGMDVDGTGHLGGTIAGSNAGAVSIDYWNGSAWATVGSVADGTAISGVALGKSGVMSWTNANIALEQKKQYANSIPLYYYKISFDLALDASVRINYIAGITASREISFFKFPVFAQGRVLLCADMAAEKNKAVASSKYMPQVYNGSDSVDIYFGESGELTCGTELFSQFGSSLYSLILMFKDNETWVMAGQDINYWQDNTFLLSSVIGCPAPLTLKTINLAAEPGAGINRSLAVWQGSNGVFMSDGRAPIPIHGDIKEYFDKSDSRCIKASLIGDSVGFIDPEKQEYHLLIASGTAATTLNTELVYDIHRNKWFEVDRGSDIQCGMMTHDTYGNSYCYGFLDTGYMELLENGTTFDGTDITHTIWTGNFPMADLFTETRISDIKLVAKSNTVSTADVTLSHYPDGISAGATDVTLSPVNAGYSIAQPTNVNKLDAEAFHSIKLVFTSNNESFEPVLLALQWQALG